MMGAINRQFFHMVTHVFDNSSLSQEIFAIDTWRAVIYALWEVVASIGLKTCFLSFPAVAWSLHGSNDHKY